MGRFYAAHPTRHGRNRPGGRARRGLLLSPHAGSCGRVDERVSFIERSGSAERARRCAPAACCAFETDARGEAAIERRRSRAGSARVRRRGFSARRCCSSAHSRIKCCDVLATCVRLDRTSARAAGARRPARRQLPRSILCSNGIYFQRVRQFLLEKLEEATLLGRLPDLWPDVHAAHRRPGCCAA